MYFFSQRVIREKAMLVYNITKEHPKAPFMGGGPVGMAYETDEFFVHYYISEWNSPFGGLRPQQRIYQRKKGTLEDWVVNAFGAENVRECVHSAGETIKGVWRPGISSQADIGNFKSDVGNWARAQVILLKKLSEIFDFVEPKGSGLNAYSHKTRELLILACTEVENYWTYYLRASGNVEARLSTNDYVKLKETLYLSDFEIQRDRLGLPSVSPFDGWDSTQPTRSLPWYDAYNKVKHNRDRDFELATVENCINSVAGALVLFASRFGPSQLNGNINVLSGLFNELFSMQLKEIDPKTYYLPKIEIEDPGHDDAVSGHSDRGAIFEIKNFTL